MIVIYESFACNISEYCSLFWYDAHILSLISIGFIKHFVIITELLTHLGDYHFCVDL